MAQRVRGRDYYGLDRFLRCFGGPGTLNDLVLMRNERTLPRANARLRRLMSKASARASRLKRDMDRSNVR
ncbi:hypothetical protein SGCZBJ_03130 [Caulobacter zeae]|uniref:DUF6966 domain-containing protein n=2 Tax=Caulobacter zeae TaxID=2055137 RepID=A0A2N5DQW6_9CAUL|nr:hypothetical protein SGCZBJ_03130 [Caulobacter zeae]